MPRLVTTAAHLAELGRPVWIDTHLLCPAAGLSHCPGGPIEHLDHRIENALLDKFGLLTPDVPAFPGFNDRRPTQSRALLQEHRPREVVVRFRNLHIATNQIGDRLRHIARLTQIGDNTMHAVTDTGFSPLSERDPKSESGVRSQVE